MYQVTLTVGGVGVTHPDGVPAGTSGTLIEADLPAGPTAEFTSTVPVG